MKCLNFATRMIAHRVPIKVFADMKRFLTLLTIAAVMAATDVRAQFTVEDKTKTKDEDVKFQDRLKNIDVSSAYYNEARARAERARLRKERNYLEITASLNATMSTYNDAWTKTRGGDNTISVFGRLFLKHIYTNGPWAVTTQAEGNYGYNRLRVDVEDGGRKGIWFKHIDNFYVQVQPELRASKNWYYSATFKTWSQFSGSYRSRTQQTDEDMLTSFMAPGYLNLSVGMTYNSPQPKFPIKISLNPLSSSGTLVFNDRVKRNYENMNATSYFGVDINKHALFSGGSSVKIEFERGWGKTGWFRYKTMCNCYYGWITNVARRSKIRDYKDYLDALDKWNEGGQVGDAPAGVPKYVELDPTVDWQNKFTIRASKYLATTIDVNLYYDKTQNTAVQIYSLLSLGITYTFKNK